ncbi:MAG: regulatory protein RecX [Chloroflexota bacterium]
MARRREHPAAARERRAAVDDPELVLAAALRFLEARSRSIAEVRRRLTGAGYQAELVEGAVTRLVELGMLDDAAFGAAWLESRDRARPRGERALRQELRLKGIDGPLAEELLVDRAASADDVDRVAAERVLARHAAALARVTDPRARRQRAYALLARNGFDPETCSAAVRAFLADHTAAD